ENCFSTGVVNASGQYAGGLIGENYANSEVSNCYSRSTVNSSSNGAGGLIGLSGNGCTVNNCYSTGAVSGSSGVGGLIGTNTSIVNSSFWDTQTSGQAASAAGTGKTTAEMNSIATFTDLATAGLSSAWDFRGYPNDDTGFDDLWDIEPLLNDGYPFLNWQYASLPSVRMTDIESIGPSTAIINAEVTNDGGAEITQRGVCWNTTGNPVTTDNKTQDGTGAGPFLSETAGLAENTVYYMRAYATNSAGTVYGNEITIKTNLSGGQGTENDPYLISTLEDLVWLMANSDEWDKHYRQTADIDASATTGWFGNQGFSPVGNTTSQYFKGRYNGDGKSVDNLFIDRPEQNHVALFGAIWEAAVENLGVVNADITGGSYTAAVIGRAISSTVTDCYSTGIVSGTSAGGLVNYSDGSTIVSSYSECDVYGLNAGGLVNDSRSYSVIDDCYFDGDVSGNENVGGLVGINRATVKKSYTLGTVTADFNYAGGLVGYMDGGDAIVYNSYSHSAVSGEDYVGGLIGYAGSDVLIERCYVTGTVNGNNYAGGLAGVLGLNSSAVNCYATGDVNGNGNVGGLVGNTYSNSIVDFCFSTGSISANFNQGGLVGLNNGAVSNSFWDTQTSGLSAPSAGTGKSTAEMNNIATFTDLETTGLDVAWDFLDNPGDDTENSEYWHIDPLVNGGYPHLTWQFLPSVVTAPVSEITFESAISGGNVTGDAGSPVTERGLLWGTSLPPTEADNKLTDVEAGQGEFISNISGLDPNITYYVRAYAINANGTMYGEVETFTTLKLTQTITFDEIPGRTYGDPGFELTASASSGLGVTYESSNTDVATVTGSTVAITGAGTTTITASQPGDGTYYAAESVNRVLDVSEATLTVTAGDKSKTYGDPNPDLTFSYAGFVYEEDESALDEVPVVSTTAGTSTGAGEVEITVSGGSSGNYAFNYVNGTLTIEKAVLTVTAGDNSKTYGDANPEFTISYSGFTGGDNVTVIDQEPVATTTADETTGAGEYEITVSGGSDNNYAFDYVSGTLTVEKAPLEATADDQSRYYGYPDPVFTISYSGLVNDDDASVIDEEPVASVTADINSGPGTDVITITGGNDNNYYFIQLNNGVLTIEKAPLTATADDKTKTYGEHNPELTISYDGFVLGEDIGYIIDLPYASTAADINSDAGSYDILLSGGYDYNYEFILVDGTLTIEKASQTIDFGPPGGVNADSQPFELSATASSGLTVTFSSSDTGVASVSGTTVTPHSAGITTITASQPGNNNYEPAPDVEQELVVQTATGLDKLKRSDIRVYPNPVESLLYVELPDGSDRRFSVIDVLGSVVLTGFVENNSINFSHLKSGIYLLKINTSTIRIIKK
ncbi:MAG: MBG domain-containing protein, partial [Bacteroidales bacterium]